MSQHFFKGIIWFLRHFFQRINAYWQHFFKGIANAKLHFTPQFSNNSFQKKQNPHQITNLRNGIGNFWQKLGIAIGNLGDFWEFLGILRNGIGKNK